MLNMTCLDGPLQGRTFSIYEGLTLSGDSKSDIKVDGISAGHYLIESNSEGMLLISVQESAKPISVAGEDESRLTLIPGVIFTVGQATFAVQEADEDQLSVPSSADTEEAAKSFENFAKSLIEAAKSESPTKSVKLLEMPVKFDFIRGFWMNESWLLQHAPIHMGSFSPIYFFPDESIQTKESFLTLELKGKDNNLYLSTPFDKLIHINGEPITSQEIFDGDFVEFGKTAFYISFHEEG